MFLFVYVCCCHHFSCACRWNMADKNKCYLQTILLLILRRRRRRWLEKKLKRTFRERSKLIHRTWTDLKIEITHSFSHFPMKLCLYYYTVLGIIGLELLALFYWKQFWDVNVLFILWNWNDIDHFWTQFIVFGSYCAVFFFALLMYRLSQVRYEQKFVDNKAKERISKWVFQENKARQIFQKTNIFLPPDMQTYVCVSGG